MSNPKLFFIGVKGLIKENDGKILLLKADVQNHKGIDKQYWDLPGGRIEEGEDALMTLKREIVEETGSEILSTSFFTAVISNHEIPLNDSKAGLVLLVYKVKLTDPKNIVLSKEHTDYCWDENREAIKKLSDKYPSEFTGSILTDADE